MIVDTDNGSTSKLKKATLQLDGDYIRPAIYRMSKDGLFTTTRREWIFYENNLYVFNYSIGSNNKYHVFVLDEYVHTYIVNLLKKNGFAS